MKNTMFKIVAVLTTAAIAVVSFAGCNKSQSSQVNYSRANFAQMQQREKTELAALVKEGTINQSQSDKIYDALSNMRSGSGQRTSRSSSASKPDWKNRSSGSTASRPSGGQRFSPLSNLVKDGTLTQAQADAVTNALFSNRFSGSSRNAASSK